MKALFISVFFSLLLLGCSQTRTLSDNTMTWQAHQDHIKQLTEWTFLGKLALISPSERHSVNIFWRQKGEDFHIILTTFIGSTVLDIKKTKRFTRIIDRAGKTYYGEDTEELIQQLSGVPLPISSLQEWVKGNPVNASFTLNDTNQVSTLSGIDVYKNNWKINFSEYKTTNNLILPSKLQLSSNDFQLKFAISNWRFSTN